MLLRDARRPVAKDGTFARDQGEELQVHESLSCLAHVLPVFVAKKNPKDSPESPLLAPEPKRPKPKTQVPRLTYLNLVLLTFGPVQGTVARTYS